MSWRNANNKQRTALRGPKPRKRVPHWERIVQKGVRVDGSVFYYKDPKWPGRIEDGLYIVTKDGYTRSIVIEGIGLIKGPIKGFKPLTPEQIAAWDDTFKLLCAPPPPLEGLLS